MDAGQGELKREHDRLQAQASSRIEREIEATRSRMDGTINRIQDKLSFRTLADEFGAMLADGTGLGSRRVMEGIRKNPVPAGLVGLSVIWLMMDRARAKRPVEGFATPHPSAGIEPKRSGRPIGERISGGIHKAGGMIQDAGEQVASVAASARYTVTDVGHTIRDTATQAGESISQFAGRARRTAESAKRGVVETYDENPLIVGAVTFAAGLIGGLLVPTTPVEDRLMGKTSKELKDRALDLGEQALDAGEKIATKVARAAQEGAQLDGNIGDRLASAATSAASVAAEEIGRRAECMTGQESREQGRAAGQDRGGKADR